MAPLIDVQDNVLPLPVDSQHKKHVPLRTARPPFKLEEHPIDEIPILRAIVVGGGISGILAGILLPAKVPKLDLVIYERENDLGGVWHTNVYPGVRCDVPAHAYQSTFAPNPEWSEAYAQGAEIKDYWKKVAQKYDALRYIQFNTRVVSTEWSDAKGKWLVTIDQNGRTYLDEANFLITATGHFSDPRLPDYPGIDVYKGHLRHSSKWDPTFDATGKRIAVIGNGASGLQVLPPLQKVAAHVDHYARNKTYVAAPVGGEDLEDLVSSNITTARKDAKSYLGFRKKLESRLFSRFGGIFKGGEKNLAAKDTITKLMSGRLAGREDLTNAVIPTNEFDPNCRRLTPGPGYLEALTADNVEYISTPIQRFTKTGIVTENGQHREVDAVICSTGHDISFSTAFPISNNGVDLQSAWRPGGDPGFPDTYLGLAAAGYPNLLLVLGPNSAGLAGTLCHSVENQLTYVAKLLRKVSQQGIRTIIPTSEAVQDFRAFCESYFPRTVMSENCSSWYNGGIKGGRIHGLWPGSATHVDIVRREPRWEDFEYTYTNSQANRFAYFGNGWSKRDVAAAEGGEVGLDLTPWLQEEAFHGKVDLRKYHEGWWDHFGTEVPTKKGSQVQARL